MDRFLLHAKSAFPTSLWVMQKVEQCRSNCRGKWYSLMDKVYAPKTLALAWTKVQANKGAAGVDGQSVERFATHAETYLT